MSDWEGLVNNSLFVYFANLDNDDSSSTRSVPGDDEEYPKEAAPDDDAHVVSEE